MGLSICPTYPVLLTIKEEDGTLIWLVVYIYGCLYFATYDIARDFFDKQLVGRFNVELQGLAARIHQAKGSTITMNRSR
jgi:hypothetical protein